MLFLQTPEEGPELLRFIASTAIVLGIAAGSYAAAAALIVNGGAIQSGTVETTCDTDGVDVSYVVDTTSGNIDSVVVSGIDQPGCEGNDVIVSTKDSTDTPIGGLSGTAADVTGDTVTCGTDAEQDPETIDSVQVQIIGTSASADSGCTSSSSI
jgi:hypothetical protein